MAKIRAVLFDLYGTLIDIQTNEHRDDVFETLGRFLQYYEIVIPGKELKELYFEGVQKQIAASGEKHPEVDLAGVFAEILYERCKVSDRELAVVAARLFRALSRERLSLFGDTIRALKEARKRYRVGIVSDAQRMFCEPELKMVKLENLFSAVVISSDYGFRKPDPRLFHVALAILNVPPWEAAYIGNRYEVDIVGAKKAGLAVAGLVRQTDGEKRFPRGLKPDFMANDLLDALRALSHGTGV